MFNGFAAVVIAYLLGSIPTAYIITRFLTGKDIRKLGGGNVGALNVYNKVGKVAAVFVGIIDVCKGIAAVAIASFLLPLP
jgi:glycerol-3-phosphate acyltransferase PlsY